MCRQRQKLGFITVGICMSIFILKSHLFHGIELNMTEIALVLYDRKCFQFLGECGLKIKKVTSTLQKHINFIERNIYIFEFLKKWIQDKKLPIF